MEMIHLLHCSLRNIFDNGPFSSLPHPKDSRGSLLFHCRIPMRLNYMDPVGIGQGQAGGMSVSTRRVIL